MINHKYPVTILISVYNQGKDLKKCFESLRDQSYQDFQIVCINDGSTDNTQDTIEEWKNIFSSERFIAIKNEQNLWLPKSLNKGLSLINTPYTARIDADDKWEKTKLEKQMKFLLSHPDCGIIGCAYANKNGSIIKIITPPLENHEIEKALPRINPFAHSCVIFNTALIKNLGGYSESLRYGQDYDLWFRCYGKTKFGNISEVLCTRIVVNKTYQKAKAHFINHLKIRWRYIRLYKLALINYIFLFCDLVFFSILIMKDKITVIFLSKKS